MKGRTGFRHVGTGRKKITFFDTQRNGRRFPAWAYCTLVLLFLFNPVVFSLRAIEQASELRNVQRKLGCKRASLRSLSKSIAVFQPELLKEIIAELGEQLQPIAGDPRLQDVRHTLPLVDGSLKGLPVLVQAGMHYPRAARLEAKVRLHNQFDLERGVPIRVDVAEGSGRGENSERAVLANRAKQDWFRPVFFRATGNNRSSVAGPSSKLTSGS